MTQLETFASLLPEIRASGPGVIIAGQVPARPAPDVMKNWVTVRPVSRP